MKDSQVDLCGQIGYQRGGAPTLAREEWFSFACNGCGDCCRGREDIVLSGYDLYRIARRLNLPPRIVARAFCRRYIGQESRLPVLRLSPVKENRNNCPFLTENHCAIHDAEPLVCALYPLAQEIDPDGTVSYFLQPTDCGGRLLEARVEDYLGRYDIAAREPTDIRWALTCMELSEQMQQLEKQLEPVLCKRMQEKLGQALYYNYKQNEDYLPQLEQNLKWLCGETEKLKRMQQRRKHIEKTD